MNPLIYQKYFQQAPELAIVIFFLTLTVATSLSLPVTGVASVLAGILLGHFAGTALVVMACTTGGTLAFLSSRFILHDRVQQRFGGQLAVVNQGIQRDGAFYVFGLRMVPVVPFWLLNLLLGITPMQVGRFYLATAAGMLPITIVLVHFGTQISAVEKFTLQSIFSPGLLFSLCLLGVMPFVTRGLLRLLQRARCAASK